MQNPGRNAPRECETCQANARQISAVIAGAGRRFSIPETAVLKPMGRGVLDRPVKPGDDTKTFLTIECENDIDVVPDKRARDAQRRQGRA
jgi:hypothetical protein